ncbi:FHA domain-containing protein [Thioalkalivibrio thiocyanodenitrificans]|uniref:FHA domain-containing protein n=1 Tax=Thioalkalivibrio thiocyanodenitrificans TaxID=243063 RepID=UPI00036CEB92|nr:FHA domain-containing protein [Thioalkalivibrio thiocyanodenitrificans]
MAHIIVYLNGQFLYDIPLTREAITIGRNPDNDVYLNDHAVSGHHARIITLLNDSLVEDLGSTNGTLVNDRPIRKRALREGDEIGIHHFRLVYTHKDGRVRPATRSVDHAPAPVGTGSGGSPSPARLHILTGPNKGRALDLVKALTTLGRPGIQVAAIQRRGQGYMLIHVDGGASGASPRVNNEHIGSRARLLQDGDTIDIAGIRMEFEEAGSGRREA